MSADLIEALTIVTAYVFALVGLVLSLGATGGGPPYAP